MDFYPIRWFSTMIFTHLIFWLWYFSRYRIFWLRFVKYIRYIMTLYNLSVTPTYYQVAHPAAVECSVICIMCLYIPWRITVSRGQFAVPIVPKRPPILYVLPRTVVCRYVHKRIPIVLYIICIYIYIYTQEYVAVLSMCGHYDNMK